MARFAAVVVLALVGTASAGLLGGLGLGQPGHGVAVGYPGYGLGYAGHPGAGHGHGHGHGPGPQGIAYAGHGGHGGHGGYGGHGGPGIGHGGIAYGHGGQGLAYGVGGHGLGGHHGLQQGYAQYAIPNYAYSYALANPGEHKHVSEHRHGPVTQNQYSHQLLHQHHG